MYKICYYSVHNQKGEQIALEEVEEKEEEEDIAKTYDIDADNVHVGSGDIVDNKTSHPSLQEKLRLIRINNDEYDNNVDKSGSPVPAADDISLNEFRNERESSPYPVTVEAQLEAVTVSGPRNNSEMVFCSSSSTPTSTRAGRSLSSSGHQSTNGQDMPERPLQPANGSDRDAPTPHCLHDITKAEVMTQAERVTEVGPNTHDLVTPAKQCSIRPNDESVASQMERMDQLHGIQADLSNLPNDDVIPVDQLHAIQADTSNLHGNDIRMDPL